MSSIADELQKLSDLKEKGVITQDEFEAQKKRLLVEPVKIVKDEEQRTFFDDRGVKVTTTLFSLPNSKTFAMSGVTAVKALKQTPSKGAPIILLIIGLLIAIGAPALGIGMVVVAVLWMMAQKPIFFVVLSTASGETQALQDPSEEWIDQVVAALNKCIVSRG